MKRGDFFQRLGFYSFKLNLGFVDGEFSPSDPGKAAWELYFELLTRITTQSLPVEHGDEKTEPDSVFTVFGRPREILRKHGPGSDEFAKLAIPVLNQIIRPFTVKWHKLFLRSAFYDSACSQDFRAELSTLHPSYSTTPKPSPPWPGGGYDQPGNTIISTLINLKHHETPAHFANYPQLLLFCAQAARFSPGFATSRPVPEGKHRRHGCFDQGEDRLASGSAQFAGHGL